MLSAHLVAFWGFVWFTYIWHHHPSFRLIHQEIYIFDCVVHVVEPLLAGSLSLVLEDWVETTGSPEDVAL